MSIVDTAVSISVIILALSVSVVAILAMIALAYVIRILRRINASTRIVAAIMGSVGSELKGTLKAIVATFAPNKGASHGKKKAEKS